MTTLVDERIDIYFDLSGVSDDYFTLNDSLKGVLDNTEYQLGGGEANDVTEFVQSISINRGRSRELDEIVVGTLTMTLKNYDGRFAPDELALEPLTYGGQTVTHNGETVYTNTNIYGSGNITPGKRITWRTADQIVFDGLISAWEFHYDEELRATVTVTAEDPLGLLARARFNAWTATASQMAGARLDAMLNRPEVDWVANRDFDPGETTLQADSIAYGTNPLTYAQTVAKSDLGRFFANRQGVLTFKDRHNLVNPTSVLTFTDDLTSTPDGVPFRAGTPTLSTELLYSDVSVTRKGGSAQLAFDAESRSKSGIRRLDLTGLLQASDSEALDMANFLVGIYREPQFRIDEVTVILDGLSDEKQAQVASLDMADVVSIEWMPRGLNVTYTDNFVIEGVSHRTSHGQPHLTTVRLSPIQQGEAFVLDDSALGVLNSGVLAY